MDIAVYQLTSPLAKDEKAPEQSEAFFVADIDMFVRKYHSNIQARYAHTQRPKESP